MNIRIEAQRKSATDIYIQSVTLNGKSHKNLFITHQEIMNGGTIKFKMGEKAIELGKIIPARI